MTGRLMGAVPQVPGAPPNTLQGDAASSASLRMRAEAAKLPVRVQQAQIIRL